eukprot:6075375-Amphidinium_carterae.1
MVQFILKRRRNVFVSIGSTLTSLSLSASDHDLISAKGYRDNCAAQTVCLAHRAAAAVPNKAGKLPLHIAVEKSLDTTIIVNLIEAAMVDIQT